jgi:hypothetical protein
MADRDPPAKGGKPYPDAWESVAELKVFRARAEEWDKLSDWSADMRRRGWRLLRVTTDASQLVAVYGKARGASGSTNPN